MDMRSAAVNVLWGAASVPSWTRYRRALRAPAAAQEQVLLSCLRRNSDTVVGREHGFDEHPLCRGISGAGPSESRTTTWRRSFIARRAEKRTC